MKIEESFFKKQYILKKKDVYTHYSKFKFEKTVLEVDQEFEGSSNNYYKIIKIKDKYFMYYRASNNPYIFENGIYNHEPNYHLEKLCIAFSNDGIHFEKKILDEENISKDKKEYVQEIIKKENNILLENDFCHNFCPTFFSHTNKFLALSGTQINNDGLFLFQSQYGIKWKNKGKIIDEKNILENFKHKNHFDTQNTIIYNPIDKYYYIYLRHNNEDDTRQVQVLKTIDFTYLNKPKSIEIKKYMFDEIYNFNPNYLENSDYFIAIPNYAISKYVKTNTKNNFMLKQKTVQNIVISNNGIDWSILNPIKLSHINKEEQICPVNGYVSNPENTKYYFYFQNNVHTHNHQIQCYSIPYNRFTRQSSVGYGFIITKQILLINSQITLNYKTSLVNKHGFIVIELLDINKKRINISKIYKGNELKKKVSWLYDNILIENEYFIKFHLYNCDLYSFSYNTIKDKYYDFIWSKGIYNRSDYMLKSTTSKPNEQEIIELIKEKKDIIWLRNSSKDYLYKDLDLFANNLQLLKNEIILVTGDGDSPIPSSCSFKTVNKILKNKYIKKWYIQNYDKTIIHKKMCHYPIGLDLHTGKWLMEFKVKQKIFYYKQLRKMNEFQIIDKIFCDTHLSKTHPERENMYQSLKDNKNINFLEEQLNFEEITQTYKNYKFVLSPRGNGIDCHRTWECFLLGCIVITTTSSLDTMWINNKLPVVIIQDWNKLNIDNLPKRLLSWIKKYNKFTEKEHIFSRFKNSYWLKK